MQTTINVIISREEQIKLLFQFEDPLCLNLSSENENEIKTFFNSLLKKMYSDYKSENKIEYVFRLDDETEDLFHDVSNKYIFNLNNEMKSIYSSL